MEWKKIKQQKREKLLKNTRIPNQQFFPRDHIEKRIYHNSIEGIVMIWKSEEDRKNPNKEPYRIITSEQFKIEYGRFLN